MKVFLNSLRSLFCYRNWVSNIMLLPRKCIWEWLEFSPLLMSYCKAVSLDPAKAALETLPLPTLQRNLQQNNSSLVALKEMCLSVQKWGNPVGFLCHPSWFPTSLELCLRKSPLSIPRSSKRIAGLDFYLNSL